VKPPAGRVPVWDLVVRVLHAVLIASVVLAWFSTHRISAAHEPAGSVALAAALLRVLWGFTGSPHARFHQFVRGPRATLHYLRQCLARREPRYLGHNPLGGWMVLALLGCVIGLGASGWLITSDAFWGDERISELHEGLGWTLVALIALHLLGVLFASLRHRENLPRAMLDGAKQAAHEGDVS
jgi:cytochrome b